MKRYGSILLGAACLLFSPAPAPAAESAPPAMSEETRTLLESVLSESQLAAAWKVLGSPAAWGSLGPNPPGVERPPLPHRPERVETLPLPEAGGAAGSGTAADPWVGVISAFLARFEYEPSSIQAPRSPYGERAWPEAAPLEAFLAALEYPPVVVRVPAGHYRETALAVPPAVWLEADGAAVLRPDAAAAENHHLVTLHLAAGLVGFTLDGTEIPGFVADPPLRVSAVRAYHRAVIADNRIRYFTGSGLTAAGSRGREGSKVTAHGNIIEYVGYSGIRGASRWDIRHNQVRWAGILRPGLGDDAIIPSNSLGSTVANNLAVGGRRPGGRHVISGQCTHENLFAGNISISVGSMRNNIQLSDGSHRNRFVGNLSLGTGASASRIHAGLAANGYGNLFEHNVSLGNPRAFRTGSRWPDEEANLIRDNYAEYKLSAIHRSGAEGKHYQAVNNTMRRHPGEIAVPDLEAAGFFAGRPPVATPPVLPAPGADGDA